MLGAASALPVARRGDGGERTSVSRALRALRALPCTADVSRGNGRGPARSGYHSLLKGCTPISAAGNLHMATFGSASKQTSRTCPLQEEGHPRCQNSRGQTDSGKRNGAWLFDKPLMLPPQRKQDKHDRSLCTSVPCCCVASLLLYPASVALGNSLVFFGVVHVVMRQGLSDCKHRERPLRICRS